MNIDAEICPKFFASSLLCVFAFRTLEIET